MSTGAVPRRIRLGHLRFFWLLVPFMLAAIPDLARATVRPPVKVTFGTVDEVVAGREMTLRAVLEAGDLEGVSFELIIPEHDWRLVVGEKGWAGSLQAGRPVALEWRLAPAIGDPRPVRGRLKVPGWNDTEWVMRAPRREGRGPGPQTAGPSGASGGRPPVGAVLGTADRFAVGKPMTVFVVLQGSGVGEARFDLLVPEAGWRIVRGETTWRGALEAGKPVHFEIEVIPTVPDPEPIRGRLSAPGWEDPPEWVLKVDGGSAARPEYAPLAGATVTATGRFVYMDDVGRTIGTRRARVVMYDNDFFFPCGPTFGTCRQFMGEGETDDGGFFTVTGFGGDAFGDLPDPYVTVEADSPSAVVQTAGFPNSTYCFKTGWVDNAGDGAAIDFGEVGPGPTGGCATESDVTGEHGAWQLNNVARESWEFVRNFTLATPGRDIPKVRVFWPDGATFYRPPIFGVDDGGISVADRHTFLEAVSMHEYGHHVLTHFAESPAPDYNNGVCDTPSPTHCVWRWEMGAIHWTEGWPDFLAQVLARFWGKNNDFDWVWGCDPITPSVCGTIDIPPHPHPDSNFEMIEGYTAAILWDQDLADIDGDNHDFNASRDNLSRGFEVHWDVVVNYDPNPFDGGHNHPTSIHEFWDGYAARRPELANRLSEIYDENHIPGKPAADLQATSVGTSVNCALTCGSLPVTHTTFNSGSVSSGETSATGILLSTDATVTTADRFVGLDAVPPLSPGAGATGSLSALVPCIMTTGTYVIGACADFGPDLFEVSEGNNCVAGPAIPVQNGPPPEVTGLAWSAGSTTSLEWSGAAAPAGAAYMVYRGTQATLPALLDGTADSCLAFAGSATTTGPILTEDPAPGSMFWYLATFRNDCGESSAGSATAGPRMVNASGNCPSCSHGKCTVGDPLLASCDPCVASICAADPFCCQAAWDGICVQEVRTVCNSLLCPESQGSCAHTLCSQGGPLVPFCDVPPLPSSCVTAICDVDLFCCQDGWDGVCVEEVASVCGMNCH